MKHNKSVKKIYTPVKIACLEAVVQTAKNYPADFKRIFTIKKNIETNKEK